MKRLYRKSELYFALVWIGIYVVMFSFADELSANLGVEKSVTAIVGMGLALISYIWISKNDLAEKYGLCSMNGKGKDYLYFVPLFAILTVNLWWGIHLNFTVLESLLYVVSMLCVGFLEEVIFRGFLFKALCKDGLKQAIVISSLTFGVGHIVNLFNGAEVLPTLLQVCYATAIGFLFTYIFHTSGSLWICILVHGTFNSLSVFANEATRTMERDLLSAVFLCVVSVGYRVYLVKKFPIKDKSEKPSRMRGFCVYSLFLLTKRISQTPSPFAMVLGKSSSQPKLSAIPRSPHIAWSHIMRISSSLQPCFCHAFTRGQ